MKIESLRKRLGYEFTDIGHLENALTHRSASSQNNERAEFLGDSILNFVIADKLYELYPDASEGELSRQRARLVNKDTLAELARDLDIGPHLRLGSGELKSGGFRRDSILADTLEAIICAIYLDSTLEQARQFVVQLFGTRVLNLPGIEELKDPKTRLQEYLQARKISVPQYQIISVSGEQHEQTFIVDCRVEKMDRNAIAEGKSRRKAEQAAALSLLNQLHGKTK